MARKKAGIVRILLNTPTIHEVPLEPAPVNFFYGKNGVGKTSIGRALPDPSSDIVWKDGKKLKVLLFNEDYVEQVVRGINGFPGVYAVSRENAEVQKKIEEKAQQKEQMTAAAAELKKELEERRRKAEEESGTRITMIWRMTAEFRQKYPEAIETDEPETFVRRLCTYRGNACSGEALDAAYQMAYGTGSVEMEPYQHLSRSLFPSCSLLDIPLISHATTELARFYHEEGSFEWAVSGYDAYLREDCCPFCRQKLPESFHEQFRKSQDIKYHQDMEKLKTFAAEYEDAVGKAKDIIIRNLGNSVESGPYRLIAVQLLQRIESNRILIRQKIDNPRLEIHLEEIDPDIRKLNEIEGEINKKIGRLIRTGRDVPEARKRCEKMIWEKMAGLCQECLDLHKSEEQKEEMELRSLELQVKTQDGRMRLLDREIAQLRASMMDISETMEKINRSLTDNDFTGFSFTKRDDNTYEIVRGQCPATGLSEGERKFVAFLYFYHTVLGSMRADAESEEKVVVVDDPATSSDSEVMSVFSIMIKEIAQRCRSRFQVGVESGECTAAHIHQLFFFTHNKVFFQMVANDSVSDNTCSLFYEIRKNRQNESTVIPCLIKSGEVGGEMINHSPVIGDYQEMWMEYRKTEDPRTLLRLCRGILGRYFLDTCHYSGTDIRKIILEQNREMFAPEGSDGLEAGFGIVSAMVALMGMNPLEMMDSVYFDIRAVNPDQIRFVFRRIFEVMKQEQHYQYMLRI